MSSFALPYLAPFSEVHSRGRGAKISERRATLLPPCTTRLSAPTTREGTAKVPRVLSKVALLLLHHQC